jgi:hypothetical protein
MIPKDDELRHLDDSKIEAELPELREINERIREIDVERAKQGKDYHAVDALLFIEKVIETYTSCNQFREGSCTIISTGRKHFTATTWP